MNRVKSLLVRALNVRPLLLAGGVLGVVYYGWSAGGPSAAEQPRVVPPPIVATRDTSKIQTAVFAGGCFWGTQGIFQHVNGVLSATAGYAGGSAETAVYELTETGSTGHAEAVRIVFDASKVSFGTLMQVFFSVAHDPTQLNRQGADVGPQYRSTVFPQTKEQANVASAYIRQLDQSHTFSSPIATTVEAGKTFYKAEDYHQDYLVNNPTQPYIAFVEQPKVDALQRLFHSVWREEPLLEAGRRG